MWTINRQPISDYKLPLENSNVNVEFM
jgi:hypothetical protein